MKANELIRLLKKHGCYLVRQAKGSHEVWHSPVTKQNFIIPDHGSQELGTELISKIKKQAGIK